MKEKGALEKLYRAMLENLRHKDGVDHALMENQIQACFDIIRILDSQLIEQSLAVKHQSLSAGNKN